MTTAAERARVRVRQRLEDLGMTGRAFARALNHGDAWISNLLAGKFALSLSELDDAARVLKIQPGELVREGHEAWDLSPTEMRVIRALRMLPAAVRDHLATLADYLVGVTPEEIDLLGDIRQLSEAELQRLQHWVQVVKLTQGGEHKITSRPGAPEATAVQSAPLPRSRRNRQQA